MTNELTEVLQRSQTRLFQILGHTPPPTAASPTAMKKSGSLQRLKCIHKGEKIPGKPCGTDLYRCNYDGVTCSPLGNCQEANRSCQNCSFFELSPVKPLPLQLSYGETCLKFSHYGDYGDVIYSLSSVYDLCRRDNCLAEFVLYEIKGTRALMDAKHAAGLLPLLEAQPYISSARWQKERSGIALDTAVRKFHNTGGQLADHYQHWLNIPLGNRLNPWLRCGEPHKVSKYVFNRTERYRGKSFPWKEIVSVTKGEAVFIGTHAEHGQFEREFGRVPYYRTSTLLEVANVIAGSELFIGNQSACRAIAEGMKHPVAVEEGLPPDTHFIRPNAWYGTDEKFWCPALPSRDDVPSVIAVKSVEVTVMPEMPESLMPEERIEHFASFLAENQKYNLPFIEVGVYKGGNLARLAAKFPHQQFFGYDTFSGLPTHHPDKDNYHQKGDLTANEKEVRQALAKYSNIHLQKGEFPSEQLVVPDRIIGAVVDVDLYAGTLASLLDLWKRLVPGGRLFCDDAFHENCIGATIAFVEFCKEVGANIRTLTGVKYHPLAYVEKPKETHERNVQEHSATISRQPVLHKVLCGPRDRRG